ncbi:MAG: 30S ribosomal protein S20 [Chloroflexi bacterium]|nr:30S ribosomal protein S20 [Chloroflexota bacterium]
MATHKSALKRHRQSLKRRTRNRMVAGGVRNAVKRTRGFVEDGDIENARESLVVVISRLDSAAAKGMIHKNTAARRKSRLVRLVNKTATSE